jgi:hypothetical protein
MELQPLRPLSRMAVALKEPAGWLSAIASTERPDSLQTNEPPQGATWI